VPLVALTALSLTAALAGVQVPEPEPVSPPARVVVAAEAADLLSEPVPGAPVAGHVFRDQVVAVNAELAGEALVARADGVTGWVDLAATRPAPSCLPDALGSPTRGRLRCSWVLPAGSDTWATWDFPRRTSPNRRERRHGTDALVDMVERVAADFHGAHPDRRLLVGDLSRPRGGPFGARFGAPGHASHQNGLDVDVYYPRRDGLERPARRPADVDLHLAREVISRFARERTQYLFVGCARRYTLRGVRKVQRLCNRYHENHVHVRLRPPRGAR